MKKQPPAIKFEGTKLYIDLRLEQFSQVDNPHNTIPFAELIEAYNHCILFYDTNIKNVFQGLAITNQPGNLKIISFPSLWQLESGGIINKSFNLTSH